jgi:hypothetical protein
MAWAAGLALAVGLAGLGIMGWNLRKKLNKPA